MHVSKWKEIIQHEPKQKDMFLSSHYQSPIPFENRQQFTGLVLLRDFYEESRICTPRSSLRSKVDLR